MKARIVSANTSRDWTPWPTWLKVVDLDILSVYRCTYHRFRLTVIDGSHLPNNGVSLSSCVITDHNNQPIIKFTLDSFTSVAALLENVPDFIRQNQVQIDLAVQQLKGEA